MLAQIQSDCTFKHGRNCLMSNIPLTRQSNSFWYFLNTLKKLKRSSGILPACLVSWFLRTDEVLLLNPSSERTDGHGCVRHNLVTLEVTQNAFLINGMRLCFPCRDSWTIFRLVNTGWTLKETSLGLHTEIFQLCL